MLYMPGCLTLYSSKLCLSKFSMLARQLCTYAANSLCFSSEGVSHQARVMDSLVAGTSRWRKAPRPSTPQRSNYLPASASHHGPAWEWARGHASTPGILCRPHAHTTEQSDAHMSSHIQNKIGSHTKGCRLLSNNVIKSWNCPAHFFLNVWKKHSMSGLQQEAWG